ncbi:hypothetical protein [Streptomyces caelestis]|uniref:Luciferase-like domain-containing protein n=1 Tax=Streptomyces caelestis TaxID=36816 RepID=A0A7W9LXV6_9ACTN|nr:hypothetical protein [Streptomyces caelestis]MBB5800053.1 hypothetical protein [Streptomyces caelestis]GGW76491.1 hypothetical protein GCM10010320_68210 [Streptomyces caelestis]
MALSDRWGPDLALPGTHRRRSGRDARAQADGYLQHYYGFLGDAAAQIAASAAVSAEMVASYADSFAAAGCDELIFVPAASGLEQVGLLAEATG